MSFGNALAQHVVPGRFGDDASDPPSRYNTKLATAVILIISSLWCFPLVLAVLPSYGTNADAWLDPSSLIVSLIPSNLRPPLTFLTLFSTQTSWNSSTTMYVYHLQYLISEDPSSRALPTFHQAIYEAWHRPQRPGSSASICREGN